MSKFKVTHASEEKTRNEYISALKKADQDNFFELIQFARS